jgi:hypothetical protein
MTHPPVATEQAALRTRVAIPRPARIGGSLIISHSGDASSIQELIGASAVFTLLAEN